MSNETDVSLTVAARLRALPGVTSQSVLFLCLLCAVMAMCGPAASAVTWTDAGAALTPLYRGDAAWGDYDDDGDLDLAMAGSTGPKSIAVVYRNDGGAFTDITGNLSPLNKPSGVTWADVNRDGNLDFLLLGPATKLYVQRTDHSGFNEAPFPLTYLSQSTADWGDYDNDGDLDLALTGYVEATMSYLAGVFRNEGGAFVQAPTPITHVSQGDLRWADYDNDGDLDLVDTDKDQTRVFRNESGLFVQALALSNGVAALADWGDFDSDGDFDLSLVYSDYYYNVFGCDVRRNDSGNFSRIVSPFIQVAEGYSEWGDYDNDGDLDLAMMGDRRTSDSATRYVSKLFANTAGVFGETAVPWDQMGKGAVHWADYDRDGDLDILLVGSVGTGSPSIRTRLYRSSGVAPNEAPAAPGGLSASAAGNTVTFSWAAATDAETPVAGLTYNVRVGTSPSGVDVVSPQSDVVTGVRRIQAFGNAGKRLAWTLQNAPVGNLSWSVQALDSAYAGGAWAPESVVNVSADTSAPPMPVVADEGYSTASLSELRASWITSDQGSGITEYLYAIGTAPSDPGSGYTVPWTSAGTAPHVTAAGMSLVPGQTYYFYVKARNGQGSYSAVGVSDGIVPGVLKPTGLEDSVFYSYGMPCGQSIGGASEPDADIAFWPGGYGEPDQYGVAIIHVPLNSIGTGGLKTSGGAILSIYQIDSGNARMRHVESSVTPAVDGSEYCDLPLSDPLPGFGAAGWHSFEVTRYIAADVAAGRSHAGFIIDAPEAGGFGTIALSENAAGNGPYMTIQQQPDTTAPSRPVVVDEGLNTSDSSRLSASWSSVDIESGIAGYRYAIGTSPTDTGSGYIVGWKPAGLATSATETGLSLAVGVTYCWYVQSVNGVGMASPTGASDGIALDLTPPTAPIVVDDGAVASNLSQIHASWLATDDKSAIAEYELAVGTTPQDPGSGYLSDWKSVGAATETSAGDLILQSGATIYVYARARNAVGLWGPVGVSDGITVPAHVEVGYVRPSGNQDGYGYTLGGPTVVRDTAVGYVGFESTKWYTVYYTTFIHFPLAGIPANDRVVLGLANHAGVLSHIDGAVANDVAPSDFSLPYSRVTTGTYYADVTAQVHADVAAGRAYAAFRLDAPDSYATTVPLSESGPLVAPYLKIISFSGSPDAAFYRNNFETTIGSEWSVTPVGDADHPAIRISTTPSGGRGFLGEFGAQTARLQLTGLPPHYEAQVSLDLLIIRSWDGNTGYDPVLNAVVGPDVWSLRFDERAPLINTTFSNIWNYPIAGKMLDFRQAYPQGYPAGDNPARTGAQEVNTLGYLSSTHPMDSVYHLTAAGAHSGSTLVIEFSASGLQAIADESWGLDNVLVTLGLDATPPDAPVVLDDGIATTSTRQLHAAWSASDAESGLSEYRYAVGTTPADPGSGYLVPWTSAGLNTSVTVTGLSLTVGQRYYFYVTAVNGSGLESAAGSSDGIMAVASSLSSIGEAKKLPDGTAVSINDVIVTATPAQMGDRMYVEAADRASGIAVTSSQAVETGDVLSVAGVLATSGGERVLTSPALAPFVSGPPLEALSMSLRDAASRAFFFSSATGAGQRGVTDPGAYGLSTIGLLVRVTGVVSDIDASFVTIADGSWPFSTGVRVSREYAPADLSVLDNLIVTGVSTIRQTGPAYQMLIRPREPSDWTRP